MNNKRYQLIIYLIASVIAITIAVQIYWNYREYQNNKELLISRIRQSLDNSVEDYFANLTKSSFIITSNDSINSNKKNEDFMLNLKVSMEQDVFAQFFIGKDWKSGGGYTI